MYEGSLCVCCLSTEDLMELFVTKTVQNVEENYAKMLAACLNIQLTETMGHDFICTICISKLKECVTFKKQIFKCISILSSLDITALMSDEELSILGLAIPKETILKIEQNINDSESMKDSNEEANVLINNIQMISPCNSTYEGYEELESNFQYEESHAEMETRPFSAKVDKVERVKTKRPVGRPRIRPRPTLPYRIEKDELKCRECGEEFPCNFTLKIHYNTHFGSHTCRKCGKGFVTYSGLKKHETCHLEGPFPCDVCGQEFRNINTLKSHVRYKHGSVPAYRCKECGVRFPTLHRRERHLAESHAYSRRRYPCKYCHVIVNTAAERSKHIAYQHEVKFFPCPVCGVRCRRQRLRAHIKTHCKTTSDNTRTVTKTEDRRFACRLCSKAFSQKVTLKYHIGAHVRKGQYRGEPGFLIVDRRYVGNNDTGMLFEDNLEEHLDETLLSDDRLDEADIKYVDDSNVGGLDVDCTNIDTIDVDYKENIDGKDIEAKTVDETDMESDGYEIFTDVGFSLPSDFDD